MSGRRILVGLALVGLAIVLQTTLVVRLSIYGVVADLVMLTVIATARRLDPEPSVLLGFTAGIVIDLLGTAPLGLRALVYTIVAYTTVRTRDRFEAAIPTLGLGVYGIALLGTVLLAVVGTLFGEGTLQDPSVVRQLLLGPAYDLVLALVVLPAVSWALGRTRKREALL